MKSVSIIFAAALSLVALPLAQGQTKAPKGKAAPAKPAPPVEAPATPPEPTAAKAAPLPEVVATAEGQEIKREELEEAFKAMLARQGVPAEAVPEEQRLPVYHMLLDNIIVSHLIDKRSAGVKVEDAEVNATFDKVKAKYGTDEELKKQVELNGQTVEGLKESIRSSLRQQHWVESQVKAGPPLTDKDAEEFFQKNPDQFKKPEQVRASHILISVPEDASPDVVVAKQKVADAVAARVKKGEDFAKVAKEASEDPGSKETGGDLDFFTKDKMVPEFADAAFGMKKGDISDPVRSKFGYHIIKLTDRKDAETMSLEQVKPQLLAFLQRQKKQEEVSKMLEALRASADVKVAIP